MSVLPLTLLLVLAFLAFASARPKWAGGLAALALVWLFGVGSGLVPNLLLAQLQTHPLLTNVNWADRNAIVVLGGGMVVWDGTIRSNPYSYGRMHEAARLYFQCAQAHKECTLLPTGGDPSKLGTSEAEVMRREFVEVGIPEQNILTETKSKNTFQNAQFSVPLLRAGKFSQVILVSTGAHLPRALLYFSAFGVAAVPAPADQFIYPLSWLPSAWGFMGTDMALHEMLGILRFQVYEVLGWNEEAKRKSAAL